MKTTTQTSRARIWPGIVVMLVGVALIALSGHFKTGQETTGAVILILGLVATAYGIVQILWTAEKTLMALAGPICLIAGLCIMTVCLMMGLFAGMIAGGFLAVAGAVLTLRK